MTLPHGFLGGAHEGYNRHNCPIYNPELVKCTCNSKYAGFHKEDCPKVKEGHKIITLPFKWSHVGASIWFLIFGVIIPYMAIKASPIFLIFWLFSLFLIPILEDTETGEIIVKPFRFIWSLIPTPSKFGYKVKMKD